MTALFRRLLCMPFLVFATLAFAESPASLEKASIDFFSSNTLGMGGQLLKQADIDQAKTLFADNKLQKSLRVLASPDLQGDILAKALVKSFVGKVEGRWILLRLSATEKGTNKRWNRLLDYEKNEGSLLIQTLDAKGIPVIEEMYSGGLLRRRTELNADGNPANEYFYIRAEKNDAGSETADKSDKTAKTDSSAKTDTTVPPAKADAPAKTDMPVVTSTVLDEHREYTYEKGRPEQLKATDVNGKILYTVRFFYTLDGAIRQTEKKLADGSSERFLYRYGPNGLNENWQDSPQDGTRWQYDAQGRVVRTEEWQDGAVLSSVVVSWAAAQGVLIASRETQNYKTKVSLVEVFDAQGRLVQSDENHAGELYRRTSQVWDADGKLTLRSILTQGRDESWAWEFEKGVLVRQRYSKEGVPVTVISYKDKDRVEELYLDGKPILRVYYHDTVRYKEEELRDGNVVRTRAVK